MWGNEEGTAKKDANVDQAAGRTRGYPGCVRQVAWLTRLLVFSECLYSRIDMGHWNEGESEVGLKRRPTTAGNVGRGLEGVSAHRAAVSSKQFGEGTAVR